MVCRGGSQRSNGHPGGLPPAAAAGGAAAATDGAAAQQWSRKRRVDGTCRRCAVKPKVIPAQCRQHARRQACSRRSSSSRQQAGLAPHLQAVRLGAEKVVFARRVAGPHTQRVNVSPRAVHALQQRSRGPGSPLRDTAWRLHALASAGSALLHAPSRNHCRGGGARSHPHPLAHTTRQC